MKNARSNVVTECRACARANQCPQVENLPRTMQNHQDPSKPRTSTTCSGSNLGTLPVLAVLLRFEALTGIACRRDRPAQTSVRIVGGYLDDRTGAARCTRRRGVQ